MLLLLIVGAAIWLVMPHPSAAPAAPQHTTAASDPASEPNSSADPGSGTWPGSGSSQTAAETKATLDAMVEGYKQSARDGSLWQKIPDTDRNRTALQAFLYVITDLRSAMLWGVDDSTAAGYLAEAKEYERKLLAQEPLGTSVKITSKGKTFSYDGDTGDGGWS